MIRSEKYFEKWQVSSYFSQPIQNLKFPHLPQACGNLITDAAVKSKRDQQMECIELVAIPVQHRENHPPRKADNGLGSLLLLPSS